MEGEVLLRSFFFFVFMFALVCFFAFLLEHFLLLSFVVFLYVQGATGVFERWFMYNTFFFSETGRLFKKGGPLMVYIDIPGTSGGFSVRVGPDL